MSRARDLAGIFNLNPLSGTTAQRPATAEVGDIFYNGTIGKTQIYTPTGWQDMASGITYGNSAGRPSSPTIGTPYFNGQEQRLELYTALGWQNIVAETPGVVGYTGSVLETNTNNTIVISGTNFVSGATVFLIGNDGSEYQAGTVTVNSIVQITAVFNALSKDLEPYDIKVVNPSNLYGLLPDSVTVNDKPTWTTASGSIGTFAEGDSVSVTVVAADEENNSVTYSLANGSSLPTGLSLNSSTGVISGTLPAISSTTTYTFTINASDGSNSVTPRTFSITSNNKASVEYLLVAGGGGAAAGWVGDGSSGGGGAGGLLYGTEAVTFGSQKLITIGTGGAGGTSSSTRNLNYGIVGNNSVYGNLTSYGGGRGVYQEGSAGGNGGSGGGGAGGGSPLPGAGGSPISGQGYVGGAGYTSPYGGGGGGGAGGAGGSPGSSSTSGSGGIGLAYSITGTSTYYAGGGASGTNKYGVATPGTGGNGGGGNGGSGINNGANGTDGLGGGGGAGGAGLSGSSDGAGGSGGRGGNGVVVIAYPNTEPALSNIPGTLTYDQPTRTGYRVYRFTAGTGTITF